MRSSHRRSYDDSHPTVRIGYVRVLVVYNSCRHQADADLQAIDSSAITWLGADT
jgi:hypothetical protein